MKTAADGSAEGRLVGITPKEFFAGEPLGLAVYEKVRSTLETLVPFDVRITKSQVAFRRAKGFAYIWLPGRYLAKPSAPVVLSFAVDRRIDSPRFKQIVHPPTGPWMHHLELRGIDEVDDDVVRWLLEAAERAGESAGRSALAVTGPGPRAAHE